MDSGAASFEDRLARVVTARVPGCRALKSAERLSGGASQETYRLVVATDRGDRPLALRRGPDGPDDDAGFAPRPGLAAEAALMHLARQAGVPEPDILHVLEESDGLGDGFVMAWEEGESLGARIARAPEFADLRPRLAYQCGEILARIHTLDVEAAGLRGRLAELSPEDAVRRTWESYQAFGTAQPMIDYTARWLLDNLPPAEALGLVHGDFRNGNFLVRPDDGIVAVLDWELAHIGDPMRDLGWLCTNSWRFGVRDLPVGGFGRRKDLFAGYEAASGRAVDPDHVRFWEVFGSFWWAVGCLAMADRQRKGADASVERPAIGRRASECQIDCVNLLIPGPAEAPAAEPRTLTTDMPGTPELLTSVRDFLRRDLMDETTGRTRFLARVAANSLDIVLRELALGPAHLAWQHAALKNLLGRDGSRDDLLWALTHALRDGTMSLDHPGLDGFLRQSVVAQVAIDQPTYSGYRAALADQRAE